MKLDIKKIVLLGMLCAVAYVVMFVGRIPVVMFLKYDPKDVIIAIGGFLYGPLSSLLISVVVSLVEMFSTSDTGFIGLIMNVLSTCSFTCLAAWIYKKDHTLKGAVIGLVTGVVVMTGVMLLWNYLVTPIHLGYPRDAVAAMLVPVFLPFNLLKGGLNAAITILLYKPIVTALRRAGLVEASKAPAASSKLNLGVILITLVVLATIILAMLAMKGVI